MNDTSDQRTRQMLLGVQMTIFGVGVGELSAAFEFHSGLVIATLTFLFGLLVTLDGYRESG